jgi:hypothetical protein
VPLATEILKEHDEEVKELVRRQVYSGQDGYGKHFPPYNTSTRKGTAYARDKHERNPLPGYGNPDYYYTGAFYDRMSVAFRGGAMKVDSDDPKRDFIILGTRFRQGAGLALFRLNPENMGKLRRQILQPNLVHRLAALTGAKAA